MKNLHGSNQRSDFLDLSDQSFSLHDAPINFIVYTMNPFLVTYGKINTIILSLYNTL